MRRIKGIGLAVALMASSALAQQPAAPPAAPPGKVEPPKPVENVVPQKRVTRLSGTFGGQRLN